MLKPRVPITLMRARLLRDQGVAKPAPEMAVALVAQVRGADGVEVHRVVVAVALVAVPGVEVRGHPGLAVEELGAGRVVVAGQLAAPLVAEEVLAVFVPLPVVAAAEALEAAREGAAVGAGVALFVLAASWVSRALCSGVQGSRKRTGGHRLVF